MAAENEKEIQQLKNRYKELANKSFAQNIFTFTGFLGLHEQDLFWQMERELCFAGFELYGGASQCDRKVLRFGNANDLGYDVEYPICCIHIEPLMHKFADKMNHRDFLGALMNLGIDRATLGDIRVGDKEAYLFCLESIADYICENLNQVKHTHVKCSLTTDMKDIINEEPKCEMIQVASVRIDAVIAKVYNYSRNDCINLFRAKKIYVNGRLCENNSRMCKQGDVINVRGAGKFIFKTEIGQTKKGKCNVEVAVFK